MRFRMIRDKESDVIRAWVWPEPLAFDAAAEESKTAAEFPVSEEGHAAAIAWIRERYREDREIWDNAPGLLDVLRMRRMEQ